MRILPHSLRPPADIDVSCCSILDVDAVLAECLRHAHTVEASYRTANEDCVIAGHVVSKGTNVQLLIGLAGRKIASPSQTPGPLTGWATNDVDSFRSVDVSERPAGFADLTRLIRPERWLNSDGQFNPKVCLFQGMPVHDHSALNQRSEPCRLAPACPSHWDRAAVTASNSPSVSYQDPSAAISANLYSKCRTWSSSSG